MQIIQLSVVIPTMNRPKSLKDTIISFLSGSKVPDEIVIVDQSLSDDTEKMLHILKQDFQEINFIYLKLEKPSLTKARNMGLDFCTMISLYVQMMILRFMKILLIMFIC